MAQFEVIFWQEEKTKYRTFVEAETKEEAEKEIENSYYDYPLEVLDSMTNGDTDIVSIEKQ